MCEEMLMVSGIYFLVNTEKIHTYNKSKNSLHPIFEKSEVIVIFTLLRREITTV